MNKKGLLLLVCLLLLGGTLRAQDDLPPVITPENAAQLKQIGEIEGGTRFGDIAWTPEGHTIAITQLNRIVFYDAATLEVLSRSITLDNAYEVTDLVFSADGLTLYFGVWYSDEEFSVWAYNWEAQTEQELYRTTTDRPTQYSDLTLNFDGDTLTAVHFHAVHTYVISSGDLLTLPYALHASDSPVASWHVNVFDGYVTFLQSTPDLAASIALDPSSFILQYAPADSLFTWDGQYWVVAQQGRRSQVEFWTFEYLQEICAGIVNCPIRSYDPTFALAEAESYEPFEMAITSDDRLLAVTYEGRTDRTPYRKIVIWDVETRSELITVGRVESPRPDHYVDIAFSADQRYFSAITWDGTVQLWAVE